MAFDYSMLKKRIKERFGSISEFCSMSVISEDELTQMMNNEKEFSKDEIVHVSTILDIPLREIQKYFFTKL